MGGTIQRSKVGGRVADSLSSYMGGTLGKSLYDTHAKQGNMQDRQLPKKKTAKEAERDVSMLPMLASVTSIHHHKQQGKLSTSANDPVPIATTVTINRNSHIPSTQRSSSSARSKKNTGSGKSARVAVGTSASLLGPMSVSK